jgi:hypothetical protein
VVFSVLFDIEDYLPAIAFRTDCEMHPYRRAPHLDDQLIKVLFRIICDIEQDNSIAKSLLLA